MKTIILTGATDGIGYEAAKMFAAKGHKLLLHGRNAEKLNATKEALLKINNTCHIELFKADFSVLDDVRKFAAEVLQKYSEIHALINNAGIFVVDEDQVIGGENIDVRFVVNTIAPYILTQKLLPILNETSRIINVSSRAQAPVSVEDLQQQTIFPHDIAYAQSKLGMIMWTLEMAKRYPHGPVFISVNPKSFLGSKMVKEAYGQEGHDLSIGAKVLVEAALSEEFSHANGMYFDNDIEAFGEPHPYAYDPERRTPMMHFLDSFIR